MRTHLVTASCIAVFLFCESTVSAQSNTNDASPTAQPAVDQSSYEVGPRPFVRNFLHDEWKIWSSPFRTSSYDTHTMKKYVIPFTIISAALIASDRKTADILPNTKDQTKWSGRVSQLGAGYSLAGAAGAVYLFGQFTDNKHARETGWLSLEALAHTQLVVFGMKQITNRRRPEKDDSPRGFWNGGDAFPSGHAASSFAVASVFAYEYRDHIAVPITAYSLAGLISASRVSARKHWVSDIFVGGSVGFLIGRYIYKTHHDPTLPGSPTGRGLRSKLTPEIGYGPYGPSLSWHL